MRETDKWVIGETQVGNGYQALKLDFNQEDRNEMLGLVNNVRREASGSLDWKQVKQM